MLAQRSCAEALDDAPARPAAARAPACRARTAAPGCPAGSPGCALAQLVVELQAHQEVQRVEQVAREVGVDAAGARPARAAARRCRARARRAAAPARARRARSGRCRASSGRSGCSSRPRPVSRVHQLPRLARTGRRRRRSGRGRRRCRPGCASRWRARLVQQRRRRRPPRRRRGRSPGASAPSGSCAVDPVAQRVAEGGQRLAPQRVGQHDVARAGRVAEVDQRGVEALRPRSPAPAHSKPSRSSSALSWSVLRICSPRPSLPITSRQLLATQLGRREQRPQPREEPRVQLAAPGRAMTLDARCRRRAAARPCSSMLLRRGLQLGHASRPASICSAIRCEWLATKLIRSSWPSTPTIGVAVAHEHRCTRCRSISSSASKARRRRRPRSARSARPRAPPAAAGGTARSSASRRSVVVKMPRRSPSRTSALRQARARQLRGRRVTRSARRRRRTACARRRRARAPSSATGTRAAVRVTAGSARSGWKRDSGPLTVARGGHAGLSALRRCQWPEAPEAPMPVSERTCCAWKPARSILRPRAAVEDREQPDADEAERHREQRRRGVREQRRALGVAERGFPDRRRDTVSATDEIRPRKPPITAPLVVQSFHSTRHEQHREVGRRRDREGQRHHEGDVLLLERDAQHHRDDAQARRGDRETRSSRRCRPCPS